VRSSRTTFAALCATVRRSSLKQFDYVGKIIQQLGYVVMDGVLIEWNMELGGVILHVHVRECYIAPMTNSDIRSQLHNATLCINACRRTNMCAMKHLGQPCQTGRGVTTGPRGAGHQVSAAAASHHSQRGCQTACQVGRQPTALCRVSHSLMSTLDLMIQLGSIHC
jgi:hypothetical protein